ncbi:gluconeogenesis factor YvcK family protein [Clostridium intestinale]|jgi:uncharacterized cofD-like protein|uniref:Putative gluconeogenesis factor n=2 Tax=Clostridium intestinale TaxID=36845 RepID=U2NJ29_9CLOT|nr:gluconeogenesis factor YvcK family protein [Clostridium intestinale]ERK29143.1 hypothetical protein CINTURNW_3573 [Clostridium intestinale URNW]QLY80496.1 YvcK family protein [Clostridium intestinale]
MRFLDWLRPGIRVKRWILFGLLGVLLVAYGFTELALHSMYSIMYKVFYVFLIITGIFVLYVSVTEVMRGIIALINKGYIKVSLDSDKMQNLIYEKRLLVKGPKIVVIGGGTGLSTMLRGLKYYTSNITAIVTVADDGGGSGDLREDLGILPPGDIRNCILALADTEPLMEELLQYRFKDGRLKNQSFGNLFLAAMDGISDNFEDAVQKMSSVLAVTGKVIPVTLENMRLKAFYENGNTVEGESQIPEEAIAQKTRISKLMIIPENAEPLREALTAIREADVIIMGPGSLYTSVLPNLLVKKISTTIKRSSGLKMYVSNIMTQPGETDNFKVSDHLRVLYKHCGKDIVDYVIANVQELPKNLIEKYREEGSQEVIIDKEIINKMGIEIIEANLVKYKDGFIRHNSEELAKVIMTTVMEKALLYDKKKIIEYMYLSQRLKESK